MADFLVSAGASLRPDPDDSSAEIVSLNTGDHVARLRELVNWSKVSFVDSGGRPFLGWVHSNALKEIKATPFKLFNEPFGQSRDIDGQVVEERLALETWKKVSIQLVDGTSVDGWINSADAAPGAVRQSGPSAGTDPESDDDDLDLGPNEVYRPFLLKAERITDIDAAALAAIIDAEAAKLPTGEWNRNSTAGTSSAAGLTQFLAGTWRVHARNKSTLLNQIGKTNGFITVANDVVPAKDGDLLNLRFEPELSIVSAAEYGSFNLAALIKDGLVDDELGDDEKARFIYLAHHEGLEGAKGFIAKTSSYTFSNLQTQVGSSKAQAFVDAAGGDTTKAYRDWMNGYLDKHIQPAKFRKSGSSASGGIAVAGQGTLALAQFDGVVPVADIGGKIALAKAIQWRLSELGYLDPPADGRFGAVSNWALSEFCDLNGISLSSGFTRSVAQRLLSPTKLLPDIVSSGTWFDKVIKHMQQQNYFICRHPECKNIIYVEGVDPDGTRNNNAHNVFNDLRIVFAVDKNGKVDFANSIWDGTTEPGDFWTLHPMNPQGAARIAFNQYKAWTVGTHHPTSPQAHEALVQAAPISVYRDLNKDFKRPGDQLDTGIFAINQHWGYDAPKSDLGRTSAGCLVGRTKTGHRQFMALIKDDPRYKVNHGYLFVTAVMEGSKILG